MLGMQGFLLKGCLEPGMAFIGSLAGRQVQWNDQTTISDVQTITTSPAFKVVGSSDQLSMFLWAGCCPMFGSC